MTKLMTFTGGAYLTGVVNWAAGALTEFCL